MRRLISLFIIPLATVVASYSQTVELKIDALMDNSMFEEGELSNGAGEYLFSGVTALNFRRRALLKFDLSATVPGGVTVDSASLVLIPSKVKVTDKEVMLHRVLAPWGEGSSDADMNEGKGAAATEGDATWTHAVYNTTAWESQGGDFTADASAGTSVSVNNDAVFMSAGMTADVNAWLTSPGDNHGWILVGDESGAGTAVRFNSRENANVETRPVLTLWYQDAAGVPDHPAGETGLNVFQGTGNKSLVVRSNLNLGICRFDVFTVTGKLAGSRELDLRQGDNPVDLNLEGTGIYIYRVTSGNTFLSGKFLLRGK